MARIDEIEEMIAELKLCASMGVGTTLRPRQAHILLSVLCALTEASAPTPEDMILYPAASRQMPTEAMSNQEKPGVAQPYDRRSK
jgi:hypothetical protein